ncbi:DUF6160 family protein [Acinetobacter sp. A3]|uniref:putative pilus system protein FilA n=1 Tax=Acinetobacter sp. A3 TaxID=2725492 RepID=UPI0014480B19|nr:DUF6160 family protein [Acinetobacter sp. A3]
MKKFTKLALVSSIALTTNAMAMQAMDDAALSATTGQDGLSIGIGISKVEIEKLFIHDNDGLAAKGKAGDLGFGGTGTAGAIVIKGNGLSVLDKDGVETNVVKDRGVVIGANYDNGGAYLLDSRNLADLVIDTDAGTGTNGAFINVAAQVSGLDIQIGEIGVTASGKQGVDDNADSIRRGGVDTNYNAILSGLTLKTGTMDANIQLGATPQGAMIKLDTTMVGGLEIKNLGILDNSTKTADRAAGEIFIESIKVTDANSTNLTLKQDISIFGKDDASNGYIQIISHGGAKDNYVKGIKLGSRDAASIGDMEIQGLQTYYGAPTALGGEGYQQGAKITISGH